MSRWYSHRFMWRVCKNWGTLPREVHRHKTWLGENNNGSRDCAWIITEYITDNMSIRRIYTIRYILYTIIIDDTRLVFCLFVGRCVSRKNDATEFNPTSGTYYYRQDVLRVFGGGGGVDSWYSWIYRSWICFTKTTRKLAILQRI